MREIKFRAWDGEKMVPAGVIPNIRHIVTTKEFDFGSMDATVQLHDAEACKIMQYTGLKDKNGKEIYEGDIVKNDNDGILEVGWCSDPEHLGWTAVKHINPRCDEEYDYWWIDCCVIGNIYENPELV